jgi:hypothetical protein
MATRLLNQLPQYRIADGTLCSGGSLNFYTTGTTTPKNVYGEPALSTNLGSTLTLNSSGQTAVDVWLSGNYRVVLKDSAGSTIWTKDDTRDTVSSTAYEVPDPASGTSGQAILTDGAVYYLDDIIQVPDPSGHTGKQLGNDGALVFWEAKAATVTYSETSLPTGITQDSTSLQVGKFKIQTGSGTAPTAAAEYTTAPAVTFGEAYTTLLGVYITPTGASGFTGRGTGATAQVSSSVTGFTARFSCGNEHGASDYNITTAVTYTWIAFGIVA